MSEFFPDKDFENLSEITKGEYENCRFLNCDLSESDLSGFKFIDCEFQSCNLSLSKLSQTLIQKTFFKECKLLGMNFEDCSDFGLSFRFEDCLLNHSSFFKLNIKKTLFKNCQMEECDFTESDLTESLFENCNLAKAHFHYTTLEKVDFRTSFHFSFDPEENKIKNAKFSKENVTGLLDKYGIKIE